jgi:chloramphenicol 3-O phosphotransferase
MYARQLALDAGLNVIADDVVWKRIGSSTWCAFEGRHVTPVAVRVSKPKVRREILRGERRRWNRGSARAADADAIYDIDIDTTHRRTFYQ